MTSSVSERLRGQLGKYKVPGPADKVFKDECVLSFDNPINAPKGVFVNLQTYSAYGEQFVLQDSQQTGNVVYLNWRKVPIPKAEPAAKAQGEEPEPKRPKQLAIGGEDGFKIDEDKQEYLDLYSIVFTPDFYEVPLPDVQQTLPTIIQMVADAVIKSNSATRQEDIKAWTADKREISPLALDLQQLNNGVQIAPSGWKCANCDLTENLWMNLTDGTILCGRRNWDGSGGNGHALEYYTATKYPLCVKLGTIDSTGHPDVYSYAEDDMVEDPLIVQHLKHWGIDMAAMSKTEKSIAELEVDQNLKFEFRFIQESGKQLEPVHGPGLTGLENLGNSCYLSSVMQVLFSLPPFQQRYYDLAPKILQGATAAASENLNVQLAKLAVGLLSGRYSSKVDEGIAPRMFKNLVGKGHAEFSTMRQQDAMEFFQYLLTVIERQERAGGETTVPDPSLAFKFTVQDRLQCQVSHKVSYKTREDNILSLPVPLEAAVNSADVADFAKLSADEVSKIPWEQRVRPIVSLESCLKALAADEFLPDFFSSATGQKGPATKAMRMGSFPPYLMLHIRKFTISQNWTPVKLDVRIVAPDELDLEWLKGHGQQPDEEPLPELPAGAAAGAGVAAAAPAAAALVPSEEIVAQLVSMGFDIEGSRRAAFHTQNRGVEDAMNWVLEHMGDADFSSPFVAPAPAGAGAADATTTSAIDESQVEMIVAMGFTREQGIKALLSTGHNLERAADWLFSHAGELDAMMETTPAPATSSAPLKHLPLFDGPGKYRLKAFITHMGPSTASGHYVCHILKQGKWVFFNDSKVALSDAPPREFAYLYLYERVDVSSQ